MEYLKLILEYPEAVGIILTALVGAVVTVVASLKRSNNIKQESLETVVQAIMDAGHGPASPVTDKIKYTKAAATIPAQNLLDKTIKLLLKRQLNSFKK